MYYFIIIFFIFINCRNGKESTENSAGSKKKFSKLLMEPDNSNVSDDSKILAEKTALIRAEIKNKELDKKKQNINVLNNLSFKTIINTQVAQQKTINYFIPNFEIKFDTDPFTSLSADYIHFDIFDNKTCQLSKLAEFNIFSKEKKISFRPNSPLVPAREKYEFSLLSEGFCLPITFFWPSGFEFTKSSDTAIVSPLDKDRIGLNDQIIILCNKKDITTKISSEYFKNGEFVFSCVEPGVFHFDYPWKDSVKNGNNSLIIKIFDNTNTQISKENIGLDIDLTSSIATITSLDESQYIASFPLYYKIKFSKLIAVSSFNINEDLSIVSIEGCLPDAEFVSFKKSAIDGFADEIVFQIKNLSRDCSFHPILKEGSVNSLYGNPLLKMQIEPENKIYIANPPGKPSVKILKPITTKSTDSNPIILASFESDENFMDYDKISLHFESDCTDPDKGIILSSVVYPSNNVSISLKAPLSGDGDYSFFVRIEDPLGRTVCSDDPVGYSFYNFDPNDLNFSIENLLDNNINQLGIYKIKDTKISFELTTQSDFKNYNSILILVSLNRVSHSDSITVAELCVKKRGCPENPSLLLGVFKNDLTLDFDLDLTTREDLKNKTFYYFTKGINVEGDTVISASENPLHIDTIVPDSNLILTFSNNQNNLKSNSLSQQIKISYLAMKNFELGDKIQLMFNSCNADASKIWLDKKITPMDLNKYSSNNYLLLDTILTKIPEELKNTEIKIFTRITDFAGNTSCGDSNGIFHFDSSAHP